MADEDVAGPSQTPDIMNDSAFFNDYAASSRKSSEEADTCRICREKGTAEEPLFYPCKCSGSIKFVHQECLMEWLSHSRKKYCELCKTPFRFTKLYSPNMPQDIPVTLFIKKALSHSISSFVTSCRAVLVISVWFVALPYFMRVTWRGLFWIADGLWTQDTASMANATFGALGLEELGADSEETFTTSATQGFDLQNSVSHRILSPVSQTLNMSSHEPWVLSGMKWLYSHYVPHNQVLQDILGAETPAATSASFGFREPSLLSGVRFFSTLTPSQALNQFIVDLSEGCIITLGVVIAFVLIFLIREWVVQQQPVINMAAFEAEHEAAQLAARGPAVQQETENDARQENGDQERVENSQAMGQGVEGVVVHDQYQSIFGDQQPTPDEQGATSPDSTQRPVMPERSKSSKATDIGRDLEEKGVGSGIEASEDATEARPRIEGQGSPRSEASSWEEIANAEDQRLGQASSSALGMPRCRKDSYSGTSVEQLSEPQHPVIVESNEDDEAAIDEIAPRTFEVARSSDSPVPLDETEHQGLEDIDDSLSHTTSETVPQTHVEPQHTSHTPSIGETPHDIDGLLERIADWLWDEFDATEQEDDHVDPNDEHVVHDFRDEPPFVHVGQEHRHVGEPQGAGENIVRGAQDLDAAAAAAREAGIDLEAIDDAEDLEGVMELIGMQGPIGNLFQNVIFTYVLIATTITGAVWAPYYWGKLVLLALAHPVSLFIKFPLQLASYVADLIVDVLLFSVGSLLYWPLKVARLALGPFTRSKIVHNEQWAKPIETVVKSAVLRFARAVVDLGSSIDGDILHVSVRSHAALLRIKSNAASCLANVAGAVRIFHALMSDRRLTYVVPAMKTWLVQTWQNSVPAALSQTEQLIEFGWARVKSGNFSVAVASKSHDIDPSLSYWGATDRFLAVIAGYVFFAFLGAAYLASGRTFTSSERGRRIENNIREALEQAGGVLKVVLIISIEMIAFPLYCGMLLDLALLPLFENATVESRIEFIVEFPWTSTFAHWFIGTCYMFHFALFVAMCRRILRSGVLYFIRDPDDPTFHPVRDVLERPVSTQLKKIAFSAMVYGTLVVACLGGVVWAIPYILPNALPIRWFTSKPVIQFPLDLLLYTFFGPVLIRSIKSSIDLEGVYNWWFRECARALSLSEFLFGERKEDEIGRWNTWRTPLASREERIAERQYTGKYVRAPASDSVRFSRGQAVFLEVDENNNVVNGEEPRPGGIHGRANEQFVKVYIPPWFRIRITLTILGLWLFVSASGLAVTLFPLAIGRGFYHYGLPADAPRNDTVAYCIGLSFLGSGLNLYGILSKALKARRAFSPFLSFTTAATAVKYWSCRILRIAYVYGVYLIVLPTFFGFLLQAYVIIPLHTYFLPLIFTPEGIPTHTIDALQHFTLGIFYSRLTIGIIRGHSNSRPARALAAVTRDGYLNPNARIATRCFFFPLTVVFFFLVVLPLPLGLAANMIYYRSAPLERQVRTYRFTYPTAAGVVLVWWSVRALTRATQRWRLRVRDELYLIGERLHNFGERRTDDGSSTRRHGVRRVRAE